MTSTGARIWPWVPAGLLACMLAGLASMAVLATRDSGFALERDYYRKAVDYDREIAQRAENARLGWRVEVDVGAARGGARTPLVVRLNDAAGAVAGARVRVEALRNASAAEVLEQVLVERARGDYEARLPLERGGLWEFRLTAERERERFTAVIRRDVGEAPR